MWEGNVKISPSKLNTSDGNKKKYESLHENLDKQTIYSYLSNTGLSVFVAVLRNLYKDYCFILTKWSLKQV